MARPRAGPVGGEKGADNPGAAELNVGRGINMFVNVLAAISLWQSAPVAAAGWVQDGAGACQIMRRYIGNDTEFELRITRKTTQGASAVVGYFPARAGGVTPALSGPGPVEIIHRDGAITLNPTGLRLPLKFSPNSATAGVSLTAEQYSILFGANSVTVYDGIRSVTIALGLTQEDRRTLDICRSEKLKRWGVEDEQLEEVDGEVVDRWFPGDVYPAAAKRAGAQGVTTAILTADESGAFGTCLVIGSAGNADLDATTCKVAKANGRLEPLPGKKHRYRMLAIRWVLTDS